MARRQDGFTIVELLIVIVVIAILAVITIVAYNGIRERATGSAQKAELSQLQRQIQTDVLKSSGEAISIETPVAYARGPSGSVNLSTPMVSAQTLSIYAVFDTFNNMSSYSWSSFVALQPDSSSNAIRLRTSASGSSAVRAYYATSAITNMDVAQTGVMNTTARHIGWVTTTPSTLYAGFDNYTDQSHGLGAHSGWNFSSVSYGSSTGYATVAVLVFPGYHDKATRTQIVAWLNQQYSVGL